MRVAALPYKRLRYCNQENAMAPTGTSYDFFPNAAAPVVSPCGRPAAQFADKRKPVVMEYP
jgi:hypothetical protein